MGAWGENPMQNDAALDWMRERVEAPLGRMIGETLSRYLENKALPEEAEAAIALLLDYTGPSSGVRYRGIDLGPEAETQNLWHAAEDVVDRLMADSTWIATWLDPATKMGSLKVLLDEVRDRNKVA